MKSFFCCLLFTVYCLLFTGTADAQFQNPNYLNTNSNVPQNLNTYTQSVFINIASTLSCILTGVDPVNPEAKCLGVDTKTNKIGYVEGGHGGLVGITSNLLAFTFYIPVSTHDYGSNLASNFGIVKEAHAQGVGFKGLGPTLNLWQTFRNITYMIFVIVFVFVGLGIMFRIKIDPRTVMTLQNQIPRIIIVLVLVTFSYAIAGFLIDLMYVSLYLIVAIFTDAGVDTTSIFASNPISAAGGLDVSLNPLNPSSFGPSGGLHDIAENVAKSISGIISSFFDGTLGTVVGAIIGYIIGRTIGDIGSGIPFIGGAVSAVGGLVGAAGGALLGKSLVGFIAGVIAYIIIVVALLTALIRLWFVLIKSYIYVLIYVVLAPFMIAMGVIPGVGGFSAWIRSILSNLVVFPATAAMLLLGKSFIDGFSRATPGTMPFIPPYVGNFLDPSLFASIIGMAIILMLPEVANMAKAALKAPETKFTAAIGQGLRAGSAISAGVPRELIGTYRAYTKSATDRLKETGLGAVLGRFIK